jgi:hypothetical protein
VRRLVAGAVVLAASTTLLAKERNVKAVYCAQGPNGEWVLQRFKPLINAQGGTVFTEMSFMGNVLEEVRLRRFYPAVEVGFDYKFDPTGKLNGLTGSVAVFGEWRAEANLFPDPDGTVPPYHVLYTRENDRVAKPENAADYIGRLNEAPIYTTIQSVPCAARLREAERMNATQE